VSSPFTIASLVPILMSSTENATSGDETQLRNGISGNGERQTDGFIGRLSRQGKALPTGKHTGIRPRASRK
jgi:hypothetical protein